MQGELTLKDILRIEDCLEISEICCPDTGIPLWSTIRVAFLRLILGDMLYGVPLSGAGTRAGSRLKQAAVITRSFAHNALRLKLLDRQYPVLLMATGTRVLIREERYFNCLSDYFVSAAPDRTFAIEDLLGLKWPFPRHYNNVLLQPPLRVEGVLRGRLRAGGYRGSARELVGLVCQRANDLLGWSIGEERRQWLERFCANGAGSLLPRYCAYQSIFKKTGARLLIKEEASYGGADNAAAILAAKHLNIATAEYQHGAISSGHDAYNFAPAILESHAYQLTLPEYFLSFGSWWGEQINAPAKKIAIGNPHRAETLNFSSPVPAHGGKILVLGDGVETNLYLELCGHLAVALGNANEVVFRPHPLERRVVSDKHPDGMIGRVCVDVHLDIYSSFREAGVVISEVSTGLFEAIGLVPKIFIWDTPKARFGYPLHPFQRFSDAKELADLIRDKNAGEVSAQQIESFWAPNWKRNYLDFVEQAVRP